MACLGLSLCGRRINLARFAKIRIYIASTLHLHCVTTKVWFSGVNDVCESGCNSQKTPIYLGRSVLLRRSKVTWVKHSGA